MLTEFLKSIRGEKALWETIITGVDVCNFRLQGNILSERSFCGFFAFHYIQHRTLQFC